MQKLLNDGLSKKAIATKLNVSIASVRSFILKHNITFLPPIAQRKSKIYNYDPKEIEDLLNKVSKHRLCKDLGISIKSLENYIKLHPIQYTKPKIKRRLVVKIFKTKT
jgi:transposase